MDPADKLKRRILAISELYDMEFRALVGCTKTLEEIHELQKKLYSEWDALMEKSYPPTPGPT